MTYDIFFISYDESNAEVNWARLIQLHPNAKRLHAVGTISDAHMLCNQLASTERFWTVEGDNWLLGKLPPPILLADLLMYDAIDPIDDTVGTHGAVKLWKTDGFINNDMSKGDFCKFAMQTMHPTREVLSIHAYNATPYEAWRKSFRHLAKCFAGIIPYHSLQQNIDRVEKHKTLNIWSYRGYIDAKAYIEQCSGDFDLINLINDYKWLEARYHEKY